MGEALPNSRRLPVGDEFAQWTWTSLASTPISTIPSHSVLSTLRPPQPYAVHLTGVTIAAPLPAWGVLQRMMRRKGGNEQDVVAKQLVVGVNLRVNPGEVLAIVGGSGSGKTTLLNSIACRLSNTVITAGAVSFLPTGSSTWSSPPSNSDGSSTPLDPSAKKTKNLKNIIGYVRQDDYGLLPYLTVRETLSFAANLRLPASVSQEMRGVIVEETIAELGLKEAADVIVGGAYRKGISGGEKRRLSIGCILVTLPSVLVLDEPTTGLDSFTAFQLLETLSRLAKRGRSVVISIHQPRSDAFALFDKVTLLSQGCVVYSGLASNMLSHFSSQGYEPEAHTNPLDFVVDVSSIDTRDDESETLTRERVGKLVVAWRERELAEGHTIWIESDETAAKKSADLEKGIERVTSRGSNLSEREPEERPNSFAQTVLLTKRGFLNVTRNYGQNIGFLLQALIIGVALGLAFYKPPETPGGIQSLKTIIFQSTPAYFYLSIIISVFIQTNELRVFDREREDHLYHTIPYVVASWLSYLPGNVAFPTIYALIIYFMCGFRTDNLAVNLLSFIAQCILQQLASWGYALLASSAHRSFASASLLANGFSIPFILSSGYLIVSLPVWVAWTRWISPYYYGFHWIARLQFTDRTFACIGTTGPALNACDGTAVLVGLRFPLDTPIFVYPLGLVGFIVTTQLLSVFVLQFYHPGGVKHAVQLLPSDPTLLIEEKKDNGKEELTTKRQRVDIVVEGLGLVVNLRSRLRRKTEIKAILTDVDARFPAGEVSVIMGPSGAGKSSLLQILAGRIGTGSSSSFLASGNVLMNGQPFDSSSMASLVAFVEQEDAHHLPALTVRETLSYAARLRLRGKSAAECEARAEEVLRMLGLKTCADNLVGGELLKGISGGEKRRLSLAVQLISDPAVLFADEPLSGLDAFTAHNVMQTLKDIAASGRTVIVSVHQPRSDIWQLFDNVLLLVKGGRTAYSGPRSKVLSFFQAAGEFCPKDFNPADFILDTISVDHRSSDMEGKTSQRVARVVDLWKRHSAKERRKSREVSSQQAIAPASLSASPFVVAFPVILSRSFKNLRRQQDVFVARLINPPFLALLFWLFFARLTLGPSSPQDRVGILQETTALPFVGMLACIAIFPGEKSLFFHEWKSSGRQSVFTFIMAYTVQEAAVSIVASLLFSLIIVFGIGLQHTPRIFVEFWITVFCLLSTGESVGIIFCTFFDNGGLAVSLVSAGITILAQLNGIISVTLPYWLEVVGWASPMKSQARIEIINEMNGLVFECTAAQISSGACIAATGDQLLNTFSIPPGGTGKLIAIIISLVLLFRIGAWLAVRVKVMTL